MICRELFLVQDKAYRDSVLPPKADKRILIEAALPIGWEAIIGPHGVVIGIERFGASAPGDVALKEMGITTDTLVEKALEILEK